MLIETEQREGFATGADLKGNGGGRPPPPPPSGTRPPTDPNGPPSNYFEISNFG